MQQELVLKAMSYSAAGLLILPLLFLVLIGLRREIEAVIHSAVSFSRACSWWDSLGQQIESWSGFDSSLHHAPCCCLALGALAVEIVKAMEHDNAAALPSTLDTSRPSHMAAYLD
jgi:hypothetical protein